MRLLASDVDGTLMRKNDGVHRSIHPMDMEALKTWTKENILIVSTGRNQLSLFKLFDTCELNLPQTYYMTSSGAEIFDENRQRIYCQMLDAHIVKGRQR